MSLVKRFDLSFNLLWQLVAASVYIAVVIYSLSMVSKGSINWAVGLGALASSAFNVFAVPSAITSRGYSIAVGYLIAVCAGVMMDFFITHSSLSCMNLLSCPSNLETIGISAISIALVIVLMKLFHCQHPPAAGLAVVLVVNVERDVVLYMMLFLALLLALIRVLLRPYLRDLFT